MKSKSNDQRTYGGVAHVNTPIANALEWGDGWNLETDDSMVSERLGTPRPIVKDTEPDAE